MKEFFDVFIFKPKRTERMVLFVLKVAFAFCYSVWIYKSNGFITIVEDITSWEKLKYFLLDGHFILFIFLFLLLYFLFFKASATVFSIVGVISMGLFIFFSRIILNLIAFAFSLLFWPFIREFLYSPFWKIRKDNEPLQEIGNGLKWFFLKVGVLRSPEQRIHSSKEAVKFLKEMRTEIIDHSERIYSKIHLRFVLGVLLYIFYFYYLSPDYSSVPFLNEFIFYFCLITILLQLLFYWAYNYFRSIYYCCLTAYREIHRSDVQK